MAISSKAYRYEQIAGELRDDIATGHVPGDFLAPELELADRFSVSHKTVRQALNMLVQEGLVGRHRGRGTVVVDRLARGEFAIVVRPKLLAPSASEFHHLLVDILVNNLHEENPNWQAKVHMGRKTAMGEEFPATLDLLEPRVLNHLRGVYSFNQLYDLEAKLVAAGIPLVMLGDKGGRYRVTFDFSDVIRHGLRHLKDVGCKRVGLVWQAWLYRDQQAFEQKDRIFAQLAGELGLECRSEWMPCFDGDITERGGYELFLRFWKQLDDRPEGVVVVDDILCRGVLRATLQLGIELPRDLKLVTHATHGIEWPYHLPLTRVEFNVAEQGRVATEMMMKLIKGRQPLEKEVLLPGRLVEGATT